MHRFLTLLLPIALLTGAALAQDYAGTFTAEGGQGTITLTLRQAGDTLSGTLASAQATFTLEGWAYPDGAGGIVHVDGAVLGFEIYLQGDALGLYLFDLDENGDVLVDTASEILMTRQGAAPPPSAAGPPTGPGDPLAPAQAAPTGADLAGTYSDGALTLRLEGGGGSYGGHIALNGRSYPLTAHGAGGRIEGSFTSDGQAFPFVATLQGSALSLETGGARYLLPWQGSSPAPSPPASSSAPTPRPPLVEPPAVQGPVLVRGAYADLTRDDALAFIDAFEFSLAQAGYAYAFSDTERQGLLDALVRSFPQASQEEQVVLSQARAIWSEVQAGWSASPVEERRAFVLAVFRLALGEEAVRAMAGGAGGAGSGASGGCATFEDCAGAFVDGDTWTDSNNAMSCWAAAGCGGYDPIDNSFSYDSDPP